jgi:hypothetical protein
MKKEAIPKTQRGLSKKTSTEKRGNPKKCKGACHKDLREKKRQPKKIQRDSLKKTSEEKRGNPKISNAHTLIKASSADLMVEGDGNAFCFRPQITSHTKATN